MTREKARARSRAVIRSHASPVVAPPEPRARVIYDTHDIHGISLCDDCVDARVAGGDATRHARATRRWCCQPRAREHGAYARAIGREIISCARASRGRRAYAMFDVSVGVGVACVRAIA